MLLGAMAVIRGRLSIEARVRTADGSMVGQDGSMRRAQGHDAGGGVGGKVKGGELGM